MPKVRIIQRKKHTLRETLSNFANRFTADEVAQILIAWLVLSFAFSFVLYPAINRVFLVFMAASAVVLGCGFIMHELMHKFSAESYRYEARFMIWPIGIVLALITAFFGFIFAAPGATVFSPDPREQYIDPRGFNERYAKISLAGPRINLIFGFIFLAIFLSYVSFFHVNNSLSSLFILLVGGLGAFINFYLCAFNMLPIGAGFIALDGLKVWRWNKLYWASFFVVSAAMTVLCYIYILIPYNL